MSNGVYYGNGGARFGTIIDAAAAAVVRLEFDCYGTVLA